MMKKTLLSMSMALTLSACGGDEAVDAVKDFPYNSKAGGMAIGDLMDDRKLCADQSWSSIEIPNSDATRVEYRCELKGAREYFAEAKDGVLASHDERRAQHREFMGGDGPGRAEQKLEDARQGLATWQAAIEDPEKHPAVVAMRERIAELEAQKEDPDISRARRMGLNNALVGARNQLSTNLEHGSADAQKKLQRLENSIDRLEQKANREVESRQESKARAEKRRNEIIDNYNVDGAEEYISWRVEDAKVRIENGHILVHKASGDKLEWEYSRLRNVLEVIHDVEVNGEDLASLAPAIEARLENRGFRRKTL